MNSKSLRRLAADHGSLHTAGLPPNYLFPPSYDASELTSLDILLAGPVGTPYQNGVWRLHLDIPPTYPAAPPTAQFRTRLWHPNIDEATGAVCVETLKRDWSSALKLRDVLVTISCLLIQPNPASALNEAAGKLASEDWDGFCRRAKLMTEIHAAVPSNIAAEVCEAQMRGEDRQSGAKTDQTVTSPQASPGQECARVTATTPKMPQAVAEDEENMQTIADTQALESDPDSDWIPEPNITSKSAATREHNIFGIKGLSGTMQLSATSQRILPTETLQPTQEEKDGRDDSDPFIKISSSRAIHTSQSFDLRVPASSNHAHSQDTVTDAHGSLQFSQPNPFSAIQHREQILPLLREFSYTWEDWEILHDTGVMQDNSMNKLDVRKRLAAHDFETKKDWEMKRFKKAGYDLAKYNRGDFGPRLGMGRL